MLQGVALHHTLLDHLGKTHAAAHHHRKKQKTKKNNAQIMHLSPPPTKKKIRTHTQQPKKKKKITLKRTGSPGRNVVIVIVLHPSLRQVKIQLNVLHLVIDEFRVQR